MTAVVVENTKTREVRFLRANFIIKKNKVSKGLVPAIYDISRPKAMKEAK